MIDTLVNELGSILAPSRLIITSQARQGNNSRLHHSRDTVIFRPELQLASFSSIYSIEGLTIHYGFSWSEMLVPDFQEAGDPSNHCSRSFNGRWSCHNSALTPNIDTAMPDTSSLTLDGYGNATFSRQSSSAKHFLLHTSACSSGSRFTCHSIQISYNGTYPLCSIFCETLISTFTS